MGEQNTVIEDILKSVPEDVANSYPASPHRSRITLRDEIRIVLETEGTNITPEGMAPLAGMIPKILNFSFLGQDELPGVIRAILGYGKDAELLLLSNLQSLYDFMAVSQYTHADSPEYDAAGILSTLVETLTEQQARFLDFVLPKISMIESQDRRAECFLDFVCGFDNQPERKIDAIMGKSEQVEQFPRGSQADIVAALWSMENPERIDLALTNLVAVLEDGAPQRDVVKRAAYAVKAADDGYQIFAHQAQPTDTVAAVDDPAQGAGTARSGKA